MNYDIASEPVTSQQVQEYRAMVKDMLHNAMESTIYMCGMVALDLDDPCYEIFAYYVKRRPRGKIHQMVYLLRVLLTRKHKQPAWRRSGMIHVHRARRSRRNTRTSSPRYCFVYFTHGV